MSVWLACLLGKRVGFVKGLGFGATRGIRLQALSFLRSTVWLSLFQAAIALCLLRGFLQCRKNRDECLQADSHLHFQNCNIF